MFMKGFFILGMIIVTALSCKQINVEEELGQVDSLRLVIVNVEIAMEQVDIEQVKNVNERMNNQIMLVKSIYGDSIEWEKAKLLSKYHAVSKTFTKFIDKQLYIKGEIAYSYQQLLDLTADLKNNIVTTDSFYNYFEKECKAVKDIKELIQKEADRAKANLNSYQEYAPKVEKLLQEQNTAKEV